MSNQREEVDMGFTRERFPPGTHMCLLFDREEYRRKIVSEFLAAGLKRGEQVRYMTDTSTAHDVISWFSDIGVDIPPLINDGSFVLFTAESAYYPTGRFSPPEVIDAMKYRYEQASRLGFDGTRGTGEMSWATRGVPGADRLVEFEAAINRASETHHFLGICQYDARLFDGATLLNILKVHPYIVAEGQIVRNPYYLRSEEYLKESKTARRREDS